MSGEIVSKNVVQFWGESWCIDYLKYGAISVWLACLDDGDSSFKHGAD